MPSTTPSIDGSSFNAPSTLNTIWRYTNRLLGFGSEPVWVGLQEAEEKKEDQGERDSEEPEQEAVTATALELTRKNSRALPQPRSLMKSLAVFAVGYLCVSESFFSSSQTRNENNALSNWDLPSPFWAPVVGLVTLSYGLGAHGESHLMTPLSFFVGLSTFPNPSNAQSSETTFFETLGGTAADYGQALSIIPDGSIMVTGYTFSSSAGMDDLLLTKFDSLGNLTWAKILGGASGDSGYAQAIAPDGSILVTGKTSSTGAGGDDVLLAKFDPQGQLSWARTLGGSGTDNGFDLLIDTEGSILLTGKTNSFGAGRNDLLLAKFNSSGALSWVKTFGGSNNDVGEVLALNTDGSILVAGETASFGANSQDLLLAKFEPTGNLTWAKALGGSSFEYGHALALAADGNIFVAGRTLSFGAGSYDLFLLKFDPQGMPLALKTVGGTGFDSANALEIAPDNSILVTGRTGSFGSGGDDLFIAKFDPLYALSWFRTLGGANIDIGFALAIDTDDSILVTGYTASSFGPNSNDLLLARFSANGTIDNCSAWQAATPTVQSILLNATDILNTTQNVNMTLADWNISVVDITPPFEQQCFFSPNPSNTSSSSTSSASIPPSSSFSSPSIRFSTPSPNSVLQLSSDTLPIQTSQLSQTSNVPGTTNTPSTSWNPTFWSTSNTQVNSNPTPYQSSNTQRSSNGQSSSPLPNVPVMVLTLISY